MAQSKDAVLDGGTLPDSVWLPSRVGEILERAAEENLNGLVLHGRAATKHLPYRELHDAALRAVDGIAPGERLMLVLDEAERFLPRLWGCFLRGIVPVVAPHVLDRLPECDANTALLILTSGTSGEPKVVPLTHANIVASIAASAYVNGYGPDDVSLNWLPLCHIGGLMRTIRETYLRCVQVQVSTSIVREDPLAWLDRLDEHRATMTWGPNSAFASIVAQRHEIAARRPWSLDCLRSVYSSGEAVMPHTMHAFAEMLAPFGFRADALRVAWGMTEACFATTSASLEDAGTPVPGVSLRIVDEHLEIRGPLVSGGDSWRRTGDLGRIESGRLSITGRSSDAIKIGGISYASAEIERVAGALPGVGAVVACGVATEQGEALVLFLSADETLIPTVRAEVARAFQVTARFVIPIDRDAIPRSSVGKVQRAQLRERFAQGAFDELQRWPFDLRAAPPSGMTSASHDAEVIASILADVIRAPLGIDDDVFACGTSSLRVAEAATRIGCELADLFAAPTPRLLAARLARPRASRTRATRPPFEPIAIVGMACRFPGSSDTDAFWQMLRDGRDALRHFSDEELIASGIDARDPAYVRAGMALDDIETFDADFFGIPARDAEIMDPQQRLLLECAWHALEDAGHPPSDRARIGIYAGGRVSEYLQATQPPLDLFGHQESPAEGFRRLVTNDKDYLATRLAFALDCRGPAVSVQTACSTSLVAVHLACQSLQNGDCDLALAGGASIRVPQNAGYLFTEGMIFSRDGHTRPFDADASGTVFGSGAGIVALRRLSDALASGDRIYAVVRGTAINNDGAGPKAAFTSPSHDGQAAVLIDAWATAGIDPSTVSYIEAHGTGTAVGDPIELAALDEAFAAKSLHTCAIGSVKSNIGHLVQAAGVASLIKTALMLRYGTLVPNANFRTPNPLIDFASSRFFVNTATRPWTSDAAPRRAGVSAFGFGGTNAHVVLEEAPETRTTAAERDHPRLLPLSAKSPAALRALVAQYIDRLADDDVSLRDLCASAQNTRAHLPCRAAVVASSTSEMRAKLAALTIREDAPPSRPRIAFLFSGQGTQTANMGRRLYETNPPFRRVIDAHAMHDVLYGPDAAQLLTRTEHAQPALVALEAALATVWRDWGITPDVVLGHSLGEITAAWAAGLLTLDEALRFAHGRGRLMEQSPPGAMALVIAPPNAIDVERHGVDVAALTAPQQTVISGSVEAVSAAVTALHARGIDTRAIPGTYGFHSAQMDAILDALESAARGLTLSRPMTPIVSTLTGVIADEQFAHPDYWRRQAREPVQLARALETANADIIVQLGPGKDDPETMLTMLARLYTHGVDIHWAAVEQEPWQRVALPQYPFQRTRYWIERVPAHRRRTNDDHPLLGQRILSPLGDVQFQAELTANVAPFARDHWVYGVRPLVMVGQVEMMRTALASRAIENAVVEQPLLLSDAPRYVHTIVSAEGGVRIFSSADGLTWDLHSSAHAGAEADRAPPADLAAIRARCREELSADAMYARKMARGAAIGPGVQLVRNIWRAEGEVLAEVALDGEAVAFAPGYSAYPGMLDAFAQCADFTLPGNDPSHGENLFLPTVISHAMFHDALPQRTWLTLRRRDDAHGDVYGVDGELMDDEGRVLVSIEGMYFKRATTAALTRAEPAYDIEWIPLEPRDGVLEDGRRIVACDDQDAEQLCAEALAVAQEMLAANEDGPLWLITRGAQATGRETAPLSPQQAALWGFGRALQREHTALRCRLIDLDPGRGSDSDDDALRRAMHRADDEVVVRGDAFFGKRLRPRRAGPMKSGAYALRPGRERTLDSLTVTPMERSEPGPGEIEIEVFATGLNFRDVLNATGRIDGPLGYECSGVITRCGAGVTRFAPGDAVMALAMHSMASHVVVDERLAVRRPRNLGFAAAAGSVVAYLTAMYALLDKAGLKKGERVLIHTAAGGVGQAAIHVARLIGAEVVATASRPKWSLVRALGVACVMDSRATGFARTLSPVDVVLSTLGNEFVDDNLAALRRGGRLIDLGHPAVLDLAAIAARATAAGVTFINFHIAQDVGIADPDRMQTLLAALADHLEAGRLPALPCRAFPLADAQHAFEAILRGAHVGKLALVHPAADRADFTVRHDATYLITGGGGAIGTRLARWLADRGARHLVLLSRSNRPVDPSLAARGVTVTTLQADVADARAMTAALATIAREMPPLRGIIHAAGVIDDGIVSRQTPERFAAVLAPKVRGAWNLHRLTEAVPLDFFLMLSSVAGLWGNAGQTSYAAANAFLDQLAHARRQKGLPATSLDYGAWQGAGMASTLSGAARERRSMSGASELDPEVALRALESALASDLPQLAVFAGNSPLLAPATRAKPLPTHEAEQGVPPRSHDDALERTRRVVGTLCAPGANVDVDRSLPELGLDSLTVLLLRGRLIAEFGPSAAVPVVRFLEGCSVAELARMAFERASSATLQKPTRIWTSLTPIKPAGSRPPMFLVPPAARTAMIFNAFAQSVDGDHPVYGLNPLGLDGRAEPQTSVEAMAAHYIDEIRSLRPDGPFILGGMCFGALVAWEMARQLTQSGAAVPLLILFDANPPLAHRHARSVRDVATHAVRYWSRRVHHHLRQKSLTEATARRIRRRLGGWNAFEGLDEADVSEQVRRVIAAHATASANYRAQRLRGDVLMLESEEFHDLLFHDRWRYLLDGTIDTVRFDGTSHLELLGERHAPALANAVTQRLSAVR